MNGRIGDWRGTIMMNETELPRAERTFLSLSQLFRVQVSSENTASSTLYYSAEIVFRVEE